MVMTGEGWEQGSFHPSADQVLAERGELCSVGNVDVLGCEILLPETNHHWFIALYRTEI